MLTLLHVGQHVHLRDRLANVLGEPTSTTEFRRSGIEPKPEREPFQSHENCGILNMKPNQEVLTHVRSGIHTSLMLGNPVALIWINALRLADRNYCRLIKVNVA